MCAFANSQDVAWKAFANCAAGWGSVAARRGGCAEHVLVQSVRPQDISRSDIVANLANRRTTSNITRAVRVHAHAPESHTREHAAANSLRHNAYGATPTTRATMRTSSHHTWCKPPTHAQIHTHTQTRTHTHTHSNNKNTRIHTHKS